MSDAKVCKIEDPRLAGYEKRTRSGREQVFYTGNDERDFDRYKAEGGGKKSGVEMHDKPDTIRIQPPEKHYYAELLDGEWWWVNGCAECNGKPRNWMTYIECDKHNRCAHCGCSRESLTEAPWGRRSGWVCKPCASIEAAEEKRSALAKVSENEYNPLDYQYTNKLICPHCATTQHHEMCEGEPESEQECETCGGKFSVEVEYSYTFSTSVIGDRITA